ncbi:hypothetical protein LR948_13900 [Roseivivax sp. GX 12232]|uniref:hypothetical protein n=1 Tax=Roseivivax sp. GX 12232 TaxID=2900547 RepID=UPI001E3959AD|nr:hypothetical protein [Roseivivax sp. GX 12232]MCE0506460.1 hypothetical protein [Roseivivax sp. GX 12232]
MSRPAPRRKAAPRPTWAKALLDRAAAALAALDPARLPRPVPALAPARATRPQGRAHPLQQKQKTVFPDV